MGATVDGFKATHQAAASLLGQIDASSGQQRADTLDRLKEALLAHVGEENSVINEAMGKPDADESFKSSSQSFLDELGVLLKQRYYRFLISTHHLMR